MLFFMFFSITVHHRTQLSGLYTSAEFAHSAYNQLIPAPHPPAPSRPHPRPPPPTPSLFSSSGSLFLFRRQVHLRRILDSTST